MEQITRDDGTTSFYLSRLEQLFNYLSGVSVITLKEYKNIIALMPSDLAARLRLVPDEKLAGRLSHLYDIYSTVAGGSPIGPHADYAIVSIEGSNSAIPVDCDLVIWSSVTDGLVFVDFTSNTSKNVIRKKEAVLEQNISINEYKSATYFVKVFKQKKPTIDISPIKSSSEPGSLGISFMDTLCRLPLRYHNQFASSAVEVFRRVNIEIAAMDNSAPPGDYKDTAIPDSFVARTLALAQTQNDASSLTLLADLARVDSEYFPYFEGLRDLATGALKNKPMFYVEGSKISETRDLTKKLAGLCDDWLARGLHAATLTDNVVCVDEAGAIAMRSTFPSTTGHGLIPASENLRVAVQHKKGHVFVIKFSESHADPKLKRVLGVPGLKKDKRRFPQEMNASDAQISEYINSSIEDYEKDVAYFSSPNLNYPKDDVWKKMLTISALASNDMDNFGRSTHSFFEGFVTTVRSTYAGASVAHYYEVCKTILASLKVSPSDNTYYVGVNGSFNSVSVVKMSSTLDSFKRCCYSVIYAPDKSPDHGRTRLKGSVTGNVTRTDFYSTDPNLLSYGLRIPYYWVALATWEIENNMESGSVARGLVAQIMIDSAFTVLINRNPFAQAAEQIRYFYMSSIGYGGSSAEIVDKTTFLNTRHHWEVLYMLRSYKTAACLSVLSTKGQLSALECESTRELAVAFPHTSFPSQSFSQTVSSMYICNTFNKFRAFHEVAEAACYNDIMEERDIYRKRLKEDPASVSGLSPLFSSNYDGTLSGAIKYITHPDFIKEEIAFACSLAVIKSKRYSGSMVYIYGTAAHDSVVGAPIIDLIYEKLNQAPIEACTMRGAMDEGVSTESHQGLRAASAVLEAAMRAQGAKPDIVNKNILGSACFMDTIMETKPTFSIISCVMEQFVNGDVVYRFRIVSKDQKGFREISVLNFWFRAGALFVETVASCLTNVLSEIDICNNPAKDKIIEDAIMESFKTEAQKNGVYVYDNSDQKRWGPNHNVNFFAYSTTAMLAEDKGLARLCLRVYDLAMCKMAKYPETLIDLIVKKGVTASNSIPIQEFMNSAIPRINSKIYENLMSQGMCQGIFHADSSRQHALKAKAHSSVIREMYNGVSVKFLATSDDSEGIGFIPYGMNRVQVVKTIHATGLRVGNLFNIMRSNPKSSFNFIIAELNSIFFKKGQMGTPSLKQRISKIDVGSGLNHIEDYMTALSNASNYLAAGGSYMGSVIVTVLNLVLHTEQWLRWDFAKSDHYYKAVELGGFPVIEPITTILSGGIANMYQRVSGAMHPDAYSKLVVNSLLCPPEELALADFSRTDDPEARRSHTIGDLTIFKGAGPLGIFQLARTDKKLSQFEKRHGMSAWPIPDSFVSLNRASPLLSDFVYTLYRSTSVSTLDTGLGVNSFFIRMAEPWVAYDRKCMRLSRSSPFKTVFNPDSLFFSHRGLSDKLKEKSQTDGIQAMIEASRVATPRPEFEIMEAQLAVRFRDAKSVMEFFGSQEAESFKLTRCAPSIQKITLRGHSAADSASYHLAMIKSLSGRRSAPLINDFKKLSVAYDSIDVPEPAEPLPLLDAIVLADNAVSLYEKFIRRDTKMILPNKVDDLKELCLDILSNKFAERLGIVLEGNLELDAERTRPHAYSKWYQDLLRVSLQYEDSVAQSVLHGRPAPSSVVNILSPRAVISRTDHFSISAVPSAVRTVLVDARSRENFVSTIKTWVSANVRFSLSRETINSLIGGRLVWAHDYYIGHDTFFRFAKGKYFKVKAGTTEGTHAIMTTTKKTNNRLSTTYRHIFMFPESVEGRTITLTPSEQHSNDEWVKKLVAAIDNRRGTQSGRWNSLGRLTGTDIHTRRKTFEENDFYMFTHITPGTTFEVIPSEDSLTMSITGASVTLPIAYFTPQSVDELKLGYTLKHEDLKLGVEMYQKLQVASGNFNKQRIALWPELSSAMDFILVSSTTDTPQFEINKRVGQFIGYNVTATQLDILRTFLIRNSKIGVGYSAHRFSQYLMNLGKRRRHEFSFLCKTIAGNRADIDSEDWDQLSAEEEALAAGKSDPAILIETNTSEQPALAPYMLADADLDVNREEEGDLYSATSGSILDWADEVIASVARQDDLEGVQTHFDSEANLFALEDSDCDLAIDADSAALDLAVSTIPQVQVTSPGSAAAAALAAMNNMFSGLDMALVGDMDSEASEEPTNTAAKHIDTINDLFSRALAETYEKIVDVKDQPLKSERSGHTVNASLESPRVMIEFLKRWIENVGSGLEMDQAGILTKNVASVTGIYIMTAQMGALDMVNPLEKFFGLQDVVLPVSLSALAVIDAMY
jgi:hypothetical protein